jgi:twitching motility protein PilT
MSGTRQTQASGIKGREFFRVQENELAAQLLFQHQLATQEQIMAHWPRISAQRNIGQLLVESGIITEATYAQLASHLEKMKTPAAMVAAPLQKPSTPIATESNQPRESAQRTPAQVKDPGRFELNQNLFEMLAHARAKGYTDLHLSSGNAVHVRQGGHLQPATQGKLTREKMQTIVREALGDDWPTFEKTGDLETVVDLRQLGRFRIAALRQRSGLDLTARLIPQAIRSFDESGLPESCRELCHWAQGLVLVTGPAGCGKTSTLASLVELVNATRSDHIITIEDPIEILFQPNGCQITQRQIGKHTQSREAALKAALREDPDIIVISELRDLDTIKLAVSAAETGHLVFGTMNTINATRTIYRLIDSFPPEEQGIVRSMVSESLRGVISQQLMPRRDGNGVIPAYEVLIVNSAVANMIRKDEAHQLGTAMITGKSSGMVVLDDSLRKLIDTGLIDPEEAWSRATNPKDFEKYLSKR